MSKDLLTGSRIRERRVSSGLKQADLARQVGISASYLNLIEHNRRRIGGKLLVNIADALGVQPTMLTQGATDAVISVLREAASERPEARAELERVDEFAGRFPGWAQLLVDHQTRIGTLKRLVETLSDRMTHDPHLATSLHEMVSTVTSIHSAASILAEPGEIEPEWQDRFHRNIFEDSARLTEASRGLVAYLDADDPSEHALRTPQEEFTAVLEELQHRVPALEDGSRTVDALAGELGTGLSRAAQGMLHKWLRRYDEDARQLPLAVVEKAVRQFDTDPVRLAQELRVEPDCVMRRLTTLSDAVLPEPVGLAVCDASGVLTYRKPLHGFPMPRFGAACPLWPLYRALNRPMMVLSGQLNQAGSQDTSYRYDAIAMPVRPLWASRDPIYEAFMLIRRVQRHDSDTAPEKVGVSCRICPRTDCAARREASILLNMRQSF